MQSTYRWPHWEKEFKPYEEYNTLGQTILITKAILVTDSVNQKEKTSDTNSLDKKEEKLRTLVMYHEEQKRPEKLYNLVPGQSDKSPNIVFGVLKAVGSCSVHLFGHLISETDPLANFDFDFV
ncbi:uncharacterized protein [Nicotiana tomentosiformis]|uniref:uncharacterized protein n=1 Tax=Nicotiana tomentosiformis TaxID=4098 RepID=UPI00144640A4|nr:uncharacterized protein LOC117277502 [Nicotiana tomentosiformis]